MSNATFDVMWREGIMEVLDQLEAENPDDAILAPKEFAEWACIYVKYIQIYRKLEVAYDQMLHPQKRADMKATLIACMGRLLEIKHYLVAQNRGMDFFHLDDILIDLKLSPQVVEIPIPRFYREERFQELIDKEKYLDALMEKFEINKNDSDSAQDVIDRVRTEMHRIEIEKKEKSDLELKSVAQQSTEQTELEKTELMDREKAVVLIQSAFRGMQWRRRIKEEERNELAFIGMRPKELDPEKDPKLLEKQNLQRRKHVQNVHQQEYSKAKDELYSKVRLMEGQDMRETIQDKIMTWFVENRDPKTGEYPCFPEHGGSKVILDPPSSSDAGREEVTNNRAGEMDDEVSMFVGDLEKAVESYMAKWHERDEHNNFQQRHDTELVKEELRPGIFEEIRQQVDAEMSVMLQNLKEMLEAERKAKGKKASKKGSKRKKGKKGGKKGKKGKKKDPTSHRSIESLYSELVSSGIVKKCPIVKISDYFGVSNFLGSTLERAGTIPDASMAQIRQILTEYFVLPLGCADIHAKLPHLKTVLLYGHEATGKTMLTHAIAHEVGANIFDISPRNTDGKYCGKQVSLMIHMVFKVAKILAPSIILIDECEKVFVTDKKKMKEFQSTEPFSRIKKELLKEVKALKPGDRVLVVGNSRVPFMCGKKDEKTFISYWNKHFYLPLPDYASRRLVWQQLFSRHQAPLPYDFDLSTLTHISEKFSSGTIHKVITSLLSQERRRDLKTRPISLEEIETGMSLFESVTPQNEVEMYAWTNKLPNRSTGNQAVGDSNGKKSNAKKKKK